MNGLEKSFDRIWQRYLAALEANPPEEHQLKAIRERLKALSPEQLESLQARLKDLPMLKPLSPADGVTFFLKHKLIGLCAAVIVRVENKYSSVDPPSAAIFLLMLAPKKHREHLLGDLEEEYRAAVLPRFGLRRARFWFWWQVCISLAPLIGQQLRRIIGLAAAWKYIGR